MIDALGDRARDSTEIGGFKERYNSARLATIDREWPARVWPFLNEIFYVMEEHSLDPDLRAAQGGLDDEELLQAVASQVPALEEEYERMRAEEVGDPVPAPDVAPTARATSTDLLNTVRAYLREELDQAGFARDFSTRRDLALSELPPRVLAAVETIRRALAAFVPGCRPRRLYDLDERGLRIRISDVEPRLAAAVDELPASGLSDPR